MAAGKSKKSWTVFSVKCCNPFKEEKHPKSVRNTRNVTEWMCSLEFGIEMGMKICDRCRKKLSSENKTQFEQTDVLLGGFKKRKHDSFPHGHRRDEKDINSSSAVMLSFKGFQLELDIRHDKYERLVKLSRDITIESKRTIFLLHRITSAPNGEEILMESEAKLDVVRQKIKQVAQELMGEDMYQFHRAISPGIQEYVEAVSFQYFIKTRSLISIEEINKQLIFVAEDKEGETEVVSSDCQNKQPRTWSLKVTPVDYLLGVADLTGELMRMCINSVGNGDIDTPFELSQFLRQIYDGFSYIGNTGPYEVSKKLYTLKQSLAKVENACYALKVRGSEIPKHMLADVFSTKTEIIDQEDGLS